jgi:protein phosphatase
MVFSLEAACGCEIGSIRSNNEDNFYLAGRFLPEENTGLQTVLTVSENSHKVCFGVFDGMGGAADGQCASFLAASTLSSVFQSGTRDGAITEELFVRAFLQMNEAVWKEADQRRNNMGTTAVILGFSDETIFVGNVGDSRAYRYRNNSLTQVTVDHYERMSGLADAGRKPHLSQCIGIAPEEMVIEPYIVQGTAQPGDVYLLCSDGLTDMVSDEQLSQILGEERAAGMCVSNLIAKAIEHGGRDNVTALVVQVKEQEN